MKLATFMDILSDLGGIEEDTGIPNLIDAALAAIPFEDYLTTLDGDDIDELPSGTRQPYERLAAISRSEIRCPDFFEGKEIFGSVPGLEIRLMPSGEVVMGTGSDDWGNDSIEEMVFELLDVRG